MKKIFFGVILFLSMISLISAAGVATSYWEDNPLKLAPGESKIVSLRLQSSENEDITLRATIDSNIATLVNGPEYIVHPGDTEVPVRIRITIQKNEQIGTTYQVYINFQQISSDEGGMISIAQGITSKLPVLVVGEQESELFGEKQQVPTNLLLIGAGILIVIIFVLIYYLLKKKKRR